VRQSCIRFLADIHVVHPRAFLVIDQLPGGAVRLVYSICIMASKRDFPAGSIPRAQVIQRTPSPAPSLTRESLTAHPLLSPSPSSASVSTISPSDVQNVSAPRYVPYTPRHRNAVVTAGTTLQSSLSVSPQHSVATSATSKLQLMNLKAEAQTVGLDTESVGWEILEKLVGEHDHSTEWSEVWTALTTGKVRLLSSRAM